jgi:hypothetical protein
VKHGFSKKILQKLIIFERKVLRKNFGPTKLMACGELKPVKNWMN